VGQFDTGRDIQLSEHLPKVERHRVPGKRKNPGHLNIRHSLGDEFRHLVLAPRQLRESGLVLSAVQ
jgi:hypothetical protein